MTPAINTVLITILLSSCLKLPYEKNRVLRKTGRVKPQTAKVVRSATNRRRLTVKIEKKKNGSLATKTDDRRYDSSPTSIVVGRREKAWGKKKKAGRDLPPQACGGNGNMSVVELFLLATAQPSDCGLKLRSCCMKSEHSIRATSAKCKSHRM